MQTLKTSASRRQGHNTISRCNILIVDDDIRILEITQYIIEHMGHSVQTSMSSTEALHLFKANPAFFDLVITDMIMPQMYGDELARAIMKIRPDIPVLISTGYYGDALKNASDLGIWGIIHKPFDMLDMQRAVQSALKDNPGQRDGRNRKLSQIG